MSPLLLFVLLFPSLLLAQIHSTSPAYPTYANELVSKSQELRLSDERYWHLLLHYMPRWFGGLKSEADGESFFVAKNGKKSPKAEIEATIRAFFQPPPTGPEAQHPQCQFIARYHWLKKKLSFDSSRLPEYACPGYQAWRKAMDPESITLIFASYYVNNPASMFGHTLLRLDKKGERRPHQLLDYVVNYAAATGGDGGVKFAFKGLFGGYEGRFASLPYYFQVQKYSNMENRDLWEYQLAILPEQIEVILEHLWELGGTYFDYYFMDENCAYHLLSLLEVAQPELHFRDRLHYFVAPSDTIKVVQKNSDLMGDFTYRPSLLSRLRQRRHELTDGEEKVLRDLIEKEGSLSDPSLAELSVSRRVLVADSALDYLLYRDRHRPQGRTDLHKRLLEERSHLPPSGEVPNIPFSQRPELGHESRRVGVGGGANGDDSFEEFRFRAVYQDLLADDQGYPENAEIEAIGVKLRFYNEEKKVWVEEATGVSVVSLVPVDRLVFLPSWNVSFGLETLRAQECNRCNAIYLRGGTGLSFQSDIGLRESYYFFVNLFSQISPWSSADYRLGPQGRAGILIDFARWWKLGVDGTFDYSPLGLPEINYTGGLEQRFSLSKNIELRIEGTKFREGEELLGAFHFYY